MAYQPMFSMGGGMDMLGGMNPFETEEERRRRQEEEQRRMEQVTGPVAPVAAPAPDQQYEAQGLQEGPAGQAMAALRKPQPFKQTLTTDPVTGQQTMKMEGAPQDFTAANPRTPTMVSGPVMPNTGPTPDEIMREQEQARQYQQMMGQPPVVTQPAAPPPTAPAPVAPGGVAQPAPQAQADTTRLGLQASQVVPGDQAQTQAQAIQPPPAAPVSQPRDLTQMAQAPGATATDVTAGTTGAVAPPAAIPPGMAVNQETGDLYRPLTGAATAAQPAAPAPANLPAAQRAAQDQMIAQDLQEGPTARTTAVEWGQIANDIRNNPEQLYQLARAESTPPRWQRIYSDMAAERFMDERNRRRGEADADAAIASGRGVSRILDRKPPDMSAGWFARMYLLRAFGFEKLYENELAKVTKTYEDIDVDGKIYTVERRGDGLVSNLYDPEGQALTDKEIKEVSSKAGGIQGAGTSKFKPEVSGTAYVKRDEQGNVTARGVRVTEVRGGRTRTAIESGGRRFDINQGWEPETISTAAAKAEAQEAIKLRYTGPIAFTRAGAEAAGKFNFDNDTNIGYLSQEPGSPLVDLNTGKRIVPEADGTIRATRNPPGVGPGARGTGVSQQGVSPAEITERRTQETRLQTVEAEENIKTNSGMATEAAKKARQSPNQLATLDRVLALTESNPEFFGSWIGSDAFRMYKDAKTSAEERAALERLAQNVAFRDPKDRAKFQALMNDIRRLEMDAVTGSGLSAQQLNTPPEAERVVRSYAVNLTDSAQASRAQVLIARANVQYNREFSRFMSTANKRLSPAALEDEFNRTRGQQIFTELQQQLGIRDRTQGAR